MKKSSFIESMRTVMRTERYSLKTEKAYLHWIRRFIFFNGKRHPHEMAELEVEQFLTYLAITKKVLEQINPNDCLVASLLYGSSLPSNT